ncbi:hypothetical protein SAMN05216252_109108 [Actinacidiphila glaucinigra]|uniref:Uncharacterized protein n=1 Tax=Actinacidiphila glaucinigra TaxID=235986 RepID=A0A239HUW4_9ACTN|nr:hypothetical protein SAMN05216252_109108 [Actinacidiphila glaucinigra]
MAGAGRFATAAVGPVAAEAWASCGPLEEVLPVLRVERDRAAGERVPRCHDHAFPLRPGTEELQWYGLAWWRQPRTEPNRRRFLTVSELIAVRVEDDEVFAATHATLLRLTPCAWSCPAPDLPGRGTAGPAAQIVCPAGRGM